MTLRTIALKNIVRRKGKMALVVFGLALAVATLVSVVSLIRALQGTVDEKLNEYGFNIIVYPRSKEMLIKYGDMVLGSVSSYQAPALGPAEVAKVALENKTQGRIGGYSPKLLEVDKVNGKRVLLAGIDFRAERRIKKWWLVENGRYPARDNEVFVGRTAAEKLGIETNDNITLAGRTLRVAGILMQTGSQDDDLIFADLDKVGEITGKAGQVSLIEVAAKRTEDVAPLVKSLRRALPGATIQSVRQAVEFKGRALSQLIKFGLGITAIIIFISALIVFTMMASAVNERKVEIGIFRAIGFRRRKIATIILTEAVILGLISGLVGYAMGFGLAQLLPIVSRGAVGVIRPSLMLALAGAALSVGIGLVASLIPAWRAANLDPVEALKSL
ncbi:MAG: ABC transporter permease [Actinomycetota bacterium]|nr:ABC transporter permease [Actinomycetota bacterium]